VNTLLRPSTIRLLRRNSGHLHYFTKDVCLAALEDTGYEIVDYFYTASTQNWIKAHSSQLSLSTRMKSAIAASLRYVLFPLNRDLTARLFGGYSLLILTK
jgi:hypothetical protein